MTIGAREPARAALSDDRARAISWQAPEGCPTSVDLQREIARLLGAGPTAAVEGEITARAVVTHGRVWAVTLETELGGRRGQRSIEAGSCAALADATALIVALMIDPDAVSRSQAAELVPEARPSAPSERPSPSPAAPPEEVARSTWSPDLLVGAFAAGSYGVLPSIDVGVGVGVGVEAPRWRLELRGTYGVRRDQRATASAVAGAYGSFGSTSANVAGCLRLRRANVGFGPCAVFEAGLVSAEGHGTSETVAVQTPWLAAGAGVFAAVPLGARVALAFRFDALAALVRPDFVFRHVDGVVYRAPALGLRATAGLEVHF